MHKDKANWDKRKKGRKGVRGGKKDWIEEGKIGKRTTGKEKKGKEGERDKGKGKKERKEKSNWERGEQHKGKM